MAEDREVLREVWDGHIPVSFNLATDEVVTMQQPDPYYVMLPRVSYFPLVIDKVSKHFVRYVAEIKQGGSDMWLDFEGQPIKWHYPIGLSWDLHGNDSTLPWNITVHFSDFPEDKIVKCHSRPAMEALYISNVKEADTLKHRGQIMDGLQKKDHNQLWLGLQNDKFDQFWGVNRKLMELVGDKPFRNIPLRLYQVDSYAFTQKLVKPANDEGELLTLGDFISSLDLAKHPSAREDMALHVVTHGVEPPFETPLQWLSEHMSYPDNFLHLCLHWRRAGESPRS